MYSDGQCCLYYKHGCDISYSVRLRLELIFYILSKPKIYRHSLLGCWLCWLCTIFTHFYINMVKKNLWCSRKACWLVDNQNVLNNFEFLQRYPNEKATGMVFLCWSVAFPKLPHFPSSRSDKYVFFSCWFDVKAFWQCF